MPHSRALHVEPLFFKFSKGLLRNRADGERLIHEVPAENFGFKSRPLRMPFRRDSAGLRPSLSRAARGGPCKGFRQLPARRAVWAVFVRDSESKLSMSQTKNSRLLTQSAVGIPCGEDENRKPSTTPFVNPCRSAFYCVSLRATMLDYEQNWAIIGPRL